MRLRSTKSVVSGRGRLAFDSLVPNVFVDSVNGNDSNNGLTLATAVQTISRAQSLMFNGAVLGLVRGSKWRETFTFQHPNITIVVAGDTANPPPVLDGRDVVPATWTQPDPVTLPNVWSVSWTRAQAATTGEAWINLWQDNEFVRAATSLADLEANGGAFYASRTAATTTVSIRSTTNPNTNGIAYEISRRGWGFRGHSTALGVAAPVNQKIFGPIEIVGCIEHYNGLAGGPGESRRVLVTDGNVHRSVTEGNLSEDIVTSRTIPGRIGSGITAFRSNATGFNHTIRRCLALQPGGTGRLNQGAFYCHGSPPNERLDSFTIDQSITRACTTSGDTLLLDVSNMYMLETILPAISIGAFNTNVNINRVQMQDLTAFNGAGIRCLSSTPIIAVDNLCMRRITGIGIRLHGLPATPPSMQRSAIVVGGSTGIGGGAGAGEAASLSLSFCVLIVPGGRPLDLIASPYVGNFNVFQGVGDAQPVFRINGFTDSSLGAWQTRTGQDLQSVWLRGSDQTAGNPNAFWLGVSSNTNAGPADGDWRINPNARAYNAAGGTLTGTFADGVTPLTAAGPQEHWNFNTRSVVAGPPTRLLRLPETKAEEREYVNEPSLWNFYP